MKCPLLIFLFILLPNLGVSQYSMSLGYFYGQEKVELGHHTILWSSKWQRDIFQFSTGIGFLQNSVDYKSSKSTYEYDHIYDGVGITQRQYFDYEATVTYRYLKIPNSFEWCVINTKDFKLFSGVFFDLEIKIDEKESKHKTWKEYYRHEHNVHYPELNNTTEITYPQSAEPFNGLNVSSEQMALGLNINPRFIFNKSYLQLEFKIGLGYKKRFSDAIDSRGGYNESVSITSAYQAQNLMGLNFPLIAGIGLSYGFTFKKRD